MISLNQWVVSCFHVMVELCCTTCCEIGFGTGDSMCLMKNLSKRCVLMIYWSFGNSVISLNQLVPSCFCTMSWLTCAILHVIKFPDNSNVSSKSNHCFCILIGMSNASLSQLGSQNAASGGSRCLKKWSKWQAVFGHFHVEV